MMDATAAASGFEVASYYNRLQLSLQVLCVLQVEKNDKFWVFLSFNLLHKQS